MYSMIKKEAKKILNSVILLEDLELLKITALKYQTLPPDTSLLTEVESFGVKTILCIRKDNNSVCLK